MAVQLYSVVANDWVNLESIINDLTSRVIGQILAPTADVTFSSLTLTETLDVTGVSTLSTIELGHASDTTLARASAGDINIEGNIIYRAGGTDVSATDGGTGLSDPTDHSLLLGSGASALTQLGVATNGQLPVGSTGADPTLATITGTANQLLVTNGAGTITLSIPDTDVTGAELELLTDNSMVDTLHRHSELSASDGTPDANLKMNATGQIGLFVAPDTNYDFYIDRTSADGAAAQINGYFKLHQSVATAQNVFSVGSECYSTHSSGTIAGLYGYVGGSFPNSNSTVTSSVGLRGTASVQGANTPAITILAGLQGDAVAAGGAVTYGISGYFIAPTVGAGSIADAITIYASEPTSGTRNYSILSLGPVVIASNKKLHLEGTLGTIGDTYFVYDSAGTTLDCFVNGSEVWNANTTRINATVDVYLNDAEFLVFDKASGNGIKVDTTTPTFGFADLLGDQFAKNTGATKPALVAYNGAVFAWQFSNGDEAYMTYHIPHDYVPGTDVHLHIHWSQNAAGATGGTIDFKYFAIYAKGHNQASGSAFTTTPITATFTSININDGASGLTRYQQHLTEVTISAATATAALFDRDDFEPDGVIELTLEMDANNLTGTPSDPFIHYADIHYQTTGIIGTKSRTPDFYA